MLTCESQFNQGVRKNDVNIFGCHKNEIGAIQVFVRMEAVLSWNRFVGLCLTGTAMPTPIDECLKNNRKIENTRNTCDRMNLQLLLPLSS